MIVYITRTVYIHYCTDLYMNVYCRVYEVTHDRAVYIDYCTHLYMNVYCRVYEVTHDRAGRNAKELTVKKGEILEVKSYFNEILFPIDFRVSSLHIICHKLPNWAHARKGQFPLSDCDCDVGKNWVLLLSMELFTSSDIKFQRKISQSQSLNGNGP